ncbi:hypothetical protein NUW54_g3346 [Trametes sanguinea]|uniref:Uncharacterized protein n=1 Tax=Trametes sanguinea TaxID=158606 RepID=A0ACC1Q2N2_9APHY|nr:hypothetical protein NUW54_g3346 [Trametes sanguinea]
MSNNALDGNQNDWDLNLAPIWEEETPADPLEPHMQPFDGQNGAQLPPQAPVTEPTEAEVIRELLHAVSLLGQESLQTRDILAQQTETLSLLQSQVRQSSLDSVEFTRRVAEQAAGAFQAIQTAGVTPGPGSARVGSVKVREPRMFSGKADDVEPFIREVKACVQLQRSGFVTDEDKTLYFSLYLKPGAAESWYNAIRINQPGLLMNFDAFVRAFVKRFQTTDLAAKYLTKIESLRQTGSAASNEAHAIQPRPQAGPASRARDPQARVYAREVDPGRHPSGRNLYEIDQELKRRGIKAGRRPSPPL